MTVGSVRGHIMRMVLFVLAGLAMQTLYALVDIYWVGRLGQQAVAAVALSSNLSFVSLAITQMLSVGCVALVSQAAGRKDHREVQRLFNQAQSLSLCAGLLFLGVGLATMRFYAERLAGDQETARLTREFLVYFLPALGLQFAMVALASALRGIGNMMPGLIAQTGSVLLNMVLAPCLIFGWLGTPPLGIAGAGLATLLATLAAVLGLIAYLGRGATYLRVRFADWSPEFALWRKMLGIGLPAGSEFLLISLNMGVIYFAIRSFGSHAQAGFGIGSRVMQVGFMPAVAISFSVAAVVGQNYGAQAYVRVREAFRESAILTVTVMLFFTVVSQLAAEPLVRVFSDEPRVVDVGADFLRTISFNYVASGLVFTAAGMFQGLGNTWPSLFASAVRCACFVLPLLWLSRQPGFTVHSIWYLSIAASTLQLVMCMWLLRKELRSKTPSSIVGHVPPSDLGHTRH